MSTNPLGKDSIILKELAPELLFPIARTEARAKSGIQEPPSFVGEDIWNCYELSWLDSAGKPISASCQIRYDSRSKNIVESKSLKLYLFSFNESKFSNLDAVADRISSDLRSVVDTPSVTVTISISEQDSPCANNNQPGECLDDLSPNLFTYTPDPDLLRSNTDLNTKERVYSDLFRSLCPVTSQPDWGRVTIEYQGNQILKENLLAYLISYRNHQGFHEDCCERIFSDLLSYCKPESLSVMCSFLRRGGIDINPIRSTLNAIPLDYCRTLRQ